MEQQNNLSSMIAGAFGGAIATSFINKAKASSSPINIQSTASYIIYQEDNLIKAQNGTTNAIDYSGTDASTIINSAISSLTYGGLIFIRTGVYIINSSILMSSNIILMGEGSNTIFYLNNNTNSTLIKNKNYHSTDANLIESNITISNITLDGNKNNQTTLLWGLLDLAGKMEDYEDIGILRNITIENVICRNSKFIGISVSQFDGVLIQHCEAYDNDNQGIDMHGRYTFRAKNYVITNCTTYSNGYDGIGIGWSEGARIISNISKNNTFDGIGTDGSIGTIINGNICEKNGQHGIMTHGGSGVYSTYSQIIGNSCLNNTDGISIVSAINTGTIVSNNTLKNNSRYGIYCTGFRNIISQNNIRDNGQDGIYVTLSHSTTLNGNTIISNSQNMAGHSGISIDGFSNLVLISGNEIQDDQTTQTQEYGIVVTGNSDGTLITSNQLSYNKTGSISNTTSGVTTIKSNIGAADTP